MSALAMRAVLGAAGAGATALLLLLPPSTPSALYHCFMSLAVPGRSFASPAATSASHSVGTLLPTHLVAEEEVRCFATEMATAQALRSCASLRSWGQK